MPQRTPYRADGTRFAVAGLAAALSGAFGTTAFAQTATANTTTLAPITVKAVPSQTPTGPVDGYLATRALTATKTDTPLVETPQSITVVTSDQIADTGAQNVQEALNYAAGVRSDAYGTDSRSDNFRIRGSNPSVYLDGLRTNYNYYTSTTRTEPYTLERIEVLRGPSSMLYGQGSTAGVVNMVSKRPQAETQREVGISYGSYNRRQIEADLTGALNEDGTLMYRMVALARKSDTQVEYVPDDRFVFAPSITWQPSARTSFTLLGLWQNDESGSSSQFFPWEGVALPNPNGMLPTNRFIGDPDWDRYNSERRSIGWSFEHAFNDNWKVRQNARWSYNHVDYRSTYGDSFSLPGGWKGDPVNKRLLGRIAYGEQKTVRMATADQHLEGRFNTGSVRHKMLFGFDLAYARDETTSGSARTNYTNGSGVPLIDAYNPVYTPFTKPNLTAQPTMRQRDMGVYLQDELRWQNWIAVAGVRFDRSQNMVENRAEDFTNRATTKRLGLMYAFENGFSPYVSYSESFTPVLDRDAGGNAFVPIRGKQIEAGLKYEAPGGNLMVNLAAYTLDEENRLVTDPNNVNESIQVGKTRNRGIDLEVKTAISRQLDVVANYSYINLDDQLENLPQHQASVWGKYKFAGALNGVSAGAGVRWLGGFTDGDAPRTPSVTLVDAMVAYDTGDWRFALNANNLLDKTYVSTCLDRGDCWFGSRRSVVASASYRF